MESASDLGPKERLAVLNGQPPDLVSGVRDGDVVIGESVIAELPGAAPLCFEARNPRKQPSGIQTELVVLRSDQVISSSIINASKHEDRTRLANTAADNLRGDKALGKAIRLRLDDFCFRLWDWWVEGDQSVWSDGADSGPIRRVLDPYVLEDAGTILFARKGRGKSFTGIFWTMSVQHGLSTPWWRAPVAIPSLFVNLERSKVSVDRRIQAAGRVLGCTGMRSFHAKGRSLSDVFEAVKKEVKRHGIGFICVDSLSRSGTGNLNDNDDTNRAMDQLNRLGCAYAVLGHTARGDDSHLFGSVMQENAADVVIKLNGVGSAVRETSIGCRVTVTDANDIAKPPPVTWALDFEQEVSALRQPEPGEFPDFSADQTPTELCRSILEDGALPVSEIIKESGLSRSTVFEALKGPSFVKLDGGRGKGSARYGITAFSA